MAVKPATKSASVSPLKPLTSVSGDVGPASPGGALFCSGWPRGDDDADDAADAASVTRRRAVWPPRAPVVRVHPGVSSESASVPRGLLPPGRCPAVGLLDCRGPAAVGLDPLDRRELANWAS